MSSVATIIEANDPSDLVFDDFRALNSSDRRPDLPDGKGLVIGEGVLVAQRLLGSRFAPRKLLGVPRRLNELAAELVEVDVPFVLTSAEVMAEVVGFHLNRGVLISADRPPALTMAEVLDGARTVAVLEGVNDHENLGAMFRNAAGLGVDAVPIRCIAARCGCRWATFCGCPSPTSRTGLAGYRFCGRRVSS